MNKATVKVLVYLLALLLPGASPKAADAFTLDVLDHEFTIERFEAVPGRTSGQHVVVLISPGFGDEERMAALGRSLAAGGIEFWRVDLLENLFVPKGAQSLRKLDGRYVAGLVRGAHETTGGAVTLMSLGYGALPVLRGARLWQLEHRGLESPYLTGAVLFSPDLYSTIPALGLEPVYDPVASATNLPLMIYQAGRRGNRWQLQRSVDTLRGGGARVYVKVLPGVTGVFYHGDKAARTQDALGALPVELPEILDLLSATPFPARAAQLEAAGQDGAAGLDYTLRPYTGDPVPLPVRLQSAGGETMEIRDYRGRVTVVNFWASWCPPCVEEIPALNRLRERMRGKPFELISVNYAETPKEVREFLSMVKVDFPVLLDEDGRYTAQWKVLVYPSTFIISPEGVIVYGVNGAIEWDSEEVVSALEALLES